MSHRAPWCRYFYLTFKIQRMKKVNSHAAMVLGWWCVLASLLLFSGFVLLAPQKVDDICLQTNAVVACWEYRIKIENNYYTARHQLGGAKSGVVFVFRAIMYESGR